eukprot:70403-Rhodomonas_salina.1
MAMGFKPVSMKGLADSNGVGAYFPNPGSESLGHEKYADVTFQFVGPADSLQGGECRLALTRFKHS